MGLQGISLSMSIVCENFKINVSQIYFFKVIKVNMYILIQWQISFKQHNSSWDRRSVRRLKRLANPAYGASRYFYAK